MFAILHALGMQLVDLFKSRRRLEAENLFLRHQLTIALRRAPPHRRLRGSDRALLTWMTWLWPSLLGMAQVVQPETILRWHRAGFKAFWRYEDLCGLIGWTVVDLLWSRATREAEIWTLRQQVNVLRRAAPKKAIRLHNEEPHRRQRGRLFDALD